MSSQANTLYPPEGLGAPKNRRGHKGSSLNLPAGTEIFSADNHISLAEDIFYDKFPERLKNHAPRVWYEDGAYELGVGGRSFLPKEFSSVLMQYDPLTGSGSNNLDGRIEELASDGIEKELAFPNALLAMFFYPDPEARELTFRLYNEYIAELQERSGGRFYGVGLINWWDAKGARKTLEELKSLGIRTFLMPLSPGNDLEGNPIDYSSTAMRPVWEVIEEVGLPVSHHIGESTLKAPCETNAIAVGMVVNVSPFREVWAKYIFSGILDRHPGLRIGWFEGGANWVPSAIQDAEHILASYRHMLDRPLEHDVRHYWNNHMYASFMVDPLGLKLLEDIGVDRVMWAADYPHNESTFGYSEKSISMVVDAVGPEKAARIVSGNVKEFLGL
ncbi:amidohydrolase family protein [Streptomyces sp. NRRL B-3229]|uniref:amidohydrolase family protein n=1 Tax=Streptomyces sp. NRRL B-3229 TaxID=1463836 RepID=UPI0004C22D8D|nr:amidohydrolase family protein [Streptomyces sp. NRRL B-3229]